MDLLESLRPGGSLCRGALCKLLGGVVLMHWLWRYPCAAQQGQAVVSLSPLRRRVALGRARRSSVRPATASWANGRPGVRATGRARTPRPSRYESGRTKAPATLRRERNGAAIALKPRLGHVESSSFGGLWMPLDALLCLWQAEAEANQVQGPVDCTWAKWEMWQAG